MSQILIHAQAVGTDWASSAIWLGALVALFYFLLIRPQRARARRHQELVSSLELGDRIQTIGGIHGVIMSMDEDSVVIEVEDGGRLRVARRAIGSKVQTAATDGG